MSIQPDSEPEVSLDLPTVAKQNWKSQDIRNYWDDLLGPFPDAFDEAMELAAEDPEHPREHHTEEQTRESDLSPVEAMKARGVPECCARSYHARRQNGDHDPIAEIAKSTPSTVEKDGEYIVTDPHHILNPMWSFLGWSFIDFYPCSFECDNARAVAIQNGKKLRELDYDDEADAMFKFLASPTYWSGYHGLAHVKNGWSIGEYTTDDNWTENIVRFVGEHQELAEVPQES